MEMVVIDTFNNCIECAPQITCIIEKRLRSKVFFPADTELLRAFLSHTSFTVISCTSEL